jgi:hypothetical protein
MHAFHTRTMIATCVTYLQQKQVVMKATRCLFFVDLTCSRHIEREDIARLQVLPDLQLCPSQVMRDGRVCLGAGSVITGGHSKGIPNQTD